MTKICKTCRHWGGSFEWDEKRAEAIPLDWGWCRFAESNLGDPLHPESLATALDDTCYWAGLKTKEIFGCVQWDEKLKPL